jgi:hypothetical protein
MLRRSGREGVGRQTMNADAKKFFEEHPAARYWYYSAGLRVPNPVFYRRLDYRPDPWPARVGKR